MPTLLILGAAVARSRAIRRVAASDRIARQAWECIAASRTRLSPLRLHGAAEAVAEKIRAALVSNTLPLIDGHARVRAPGDHVCVCCGEPIRVGQAEYEPQEHRGLYAHGSCFTAWREESARLRQVPGGEPAPRLRARRTPQTESLDSPPRAVASAHLPPGRLLGAGWRPTPLASGLALLQPSSAAVAARQLP